MRAIPALRIFFLAVLVSLVPASSFAGVFLSVTIAPQRCRCMCSRFVPGTAISGPLATGPTGKPATSGYREPGCLRPAGISLDSWLLGLGWRSLLWHAGYWGPHVGFYGGVNYGYGYGGVGLLWRALGGWTFCL